MAKPAAGGHAARIRMEKWFPSLVGTAWSVTSDMSPRYNCHAHAMGENHRNWDPFPTRYWPEGVPRSGTLEAYLAAYATKGWSRCPDGTLEPGFEKIALFEGYISAVQAITISHTARQLPDGRWTSKIGTDHDIEHDLRAIEGWEYGVVRAYMSRLRG